MSASLISSLLVAAASLFVLGALGSLIAGNHTRGRLALVWSHWFAAAGSVVLATVGLMGLVSAQTLMVEFTLKLPLFVITSPFRIDQLASLFFLVIGGIGVAASVYGLGYQRQFIGHYRLHGFGAAYNLFLMSLALVVSANHALVFMVAWELMTVTSYLLVIFEHREESNVKAGLLYFLMTQLGSAFLLLMFFGLYRALGSFEFDVIRAQASALPLLTQNLVIAAAVIGFGTKAGIIPLHIWLPEAHPAAPSHVSALMSGVMIKTAILMLVRVLFEFFPDASVIWGLVILGLGALGAVLGVLYALAEHDLKRLLAYHSVENIGIILLGLGAASTLSALGLPILAAIALTAALFHTVNHAVFKSLLFLGAGSVIHATHTRNMEAFGGLMRRMPWTGLWFFVGAAAISALPPLNGFASEWLTFQALFSGLESGNHLIQAMFLFAITALALTGGLAAACFVKAFGATFLARPRSHMSEQAHESDWTMTLPMAFLALVCIVLGVSSGPVTTTLLRVSTSVIGQSFIPYSFTLPVAPLAELAGLLIGTGIVVASIVAFVSRKQRVVVGPTWDCGRPLTARAEITATSFSRSLLMIFQGVLRPSKQTDREYVDAQTRYFTKSQTVTLETPNLYLERVYQPLYDWLVRLANRTKGIQSGNISMYLLYSFLTLIALLIWATK